MVEHNDKEANDDNKEQQVSGHASIIEPVYVERRFDKEKAKYPEDGENDATNHFTQLKGTLHGIQLLSRSIYESNRARPLAEHTVVLVSICIVVAVCQEINILPQSRHFPTAS